MAERWQQWMPFHIDRFRGSPDVQAMHPAARCGYLFLLATAWQTADCTIANDPIDLANASGLGDELWAIYGPRILRKFVVAGDRLRNEVLFAEWSEAKRVFEHNSKVRSEAGRIGNAKRWGRKCDDSDRKRIASTSQKIATGTGTGTGTKEEIPSRAKKPRERKPSSEIYGMVKEHVFAYYRHMNEGSEPPWDAAEGKQLAMMLAASPKETAESWKRMLYARSQSDVNHAERPSLWLRKLTNYRQAIDKFRQPVKAAPVQPKINYLSSEVQ